MTDALAHRGPDGRGIYIDHYLGLGHRRLAIIDLSDAASQPMRSADKNFVVSYNGEIYNFCALRSQLKHRYDFRSRSDTEVVVNAFAAWGVNALKKFNGMFALALWDKRSRTLTLARDRYGIKPLYYWRNEKVFIFASEIKAFLKHPEFKAVVDREALLEYFTFQNNFTDKTLFNGVKLLPAGSFLQVSLKEGAAINAHCYWDFCFKEEKSLKNNNEYYEELDRLFKRAVKRQLVGDVEVGSFLSGGIDSGSIVAAASHYQPGLKTFCVGFDLSSASGLELSFDERKKAERLSYLYQTEHYEMVLKSGDMKRCLPRLIWSLEDLRLGQSYPNFYAAKIASRFVKVCLSGIGGDELFAGYPWRYYRTIHSKNFTHYIEEYYRYWQRLVPNKIIRNLFSPVWDSVKHVWTQDIFKNVFPPRMSLPRTAEDYINHSLYFEGKTFLNGLFIVEDKLSMANSMEVRVPFFDNDLVDFAMKIPVKLKLKNIKKVLSIDEDELAKREKYFARMRDGKIILRKVFGKYVDDSIIKQYKQGFSGPDASWFRGESIEYVKTLLLSRKANIYDYFDYRTVQSLIAEHLGGKFNRRLFIWSLLCFEWWLKIFISGKAQEKL
jgi:asparagine synthase (glutamine-hydrolysing)